MESLTPTRIGLAVALLLGSIAASRRTGLSHRLRDEVRIRYQRPSDDPERAVDIAWDRLERRLAHRYRPRRATETVREYLESVPGDDFDQLIGHIERARYGHDISSAEARRVIDRVDEVV
ncbi:MAG: DUF4129 domain-containing protein [Natrialbaceae archaeon]|nr:DUF4129 domain-containing protein [Natrialbaceae archaeon]